MEQSIRTAPEGQAELLEPREVPHEGGHGAARIEHRPANDSQGEPTRYGDCRKRRLADCPAKFRKLYRRAWSGKSRQAAIRIHCLECCGWLSREVDRCSAPACPLFEYRGGRK